MMTILISSVDKNKGWLSLEFLKDYFDVTNTYVVMKLKTIYLPFLVKEWQPETTYNEHGQQVSATPRTDVQAPDLYIPLMSFVTFILLVGISEGLVSDT
jgi:protein transport protein YIF1